VKEGRQAGARITVLVAMLYEKGGRGSGRLLCTCINIIDDVTHLGVKGGRQSGVLKAVHKYVVMHKRGGHCARTYLHRRARRSAHTLNNPSITRLACCRGWRV